MGKKTHLSDAELALYARQIIWQDWNIEAQLALANKHVIIVGVGGLGCPVSESLVRAGVGNLTIIDFDTIEASNLQRQNLFFANDIGSHKAEVAVTQLRQHNPYVDISAKVVKLTQDNIANYLHSADLVIDCTDNFTIRDLINRHCLHHCLAFVSSAAIGQSGQLAFYDFSKNNPNLVQQACYACLFGDEKQQQARCSEVGVMVSTTQVVSSLCVELALQYLGLGKNALFNQLLIWDGVNMVQKKLHFKKSPDCNVCQG